MFGSVGFGVSMICLDLFWVCLCDYLFVYCVFWVCLWLVVVCYC